MWCNTPCLQSNLRSDSIHVDVAAIAQDSVRRAHEEQMQAEKRRAEELKQLMADEEEQEKNSEAERLRREKEAAEAEAARVATQERLKEEARRAFEQEQQRCRELEQQRKREEEARCREAEQLEREAQQECERQERQEAVKFFCRRYGFSGATQPRKSGCTVFGSVTYPLHQAAELADARIVEMLLKEGASPTMKNGSKQTAAQAAQKMNKDGSHERVLQALKTAATGGAATGGA
eukprot:CAMPEP_0172844348 /NCGR_PEP_ID=MMETSP1075-20121228/32151_1 /TAXON_ID=2916 /ORGANISM="Ceratium fusus, Strain PA161109" /LENGTH=234 /DNA_ID=CAMNT_0013688775 /DNA_START=70 /DNA_END=774 /DNA_ORIENTATION=+